jgi:hypothetical protein
MKKMEETEEEKEQPPWRLTHREQEHGPDRAMHIARPIVAGIARGNPAGRLVAGQSSSFGFEKDSAS